MADNIIVMHEGYITARFTKKQATSEKIIKAATGSLLEYNTGGKQ